MRRFVLLILGLLLSVGSSGRAEDDTPPAPRTVAESADAALAAFRAADRAGLGAAAAIDDPDPWLVADEMVRRRELEAASAFAVAAPRIDTQGLAAYLVSRRGAADDAALRGRFAAAELALAAEEFEAASTALGPAARAPLADILEVRLSFARGQALRGLLRFEESVTAYLAAAEAAERFGWLARASAAYKAAATSADRSADFATAVTALKRCLLLCERRKDEVGAARSLANLAIFHQSAGHAAEALSAFERALAALRALGDERGAATTLGNLGSVHFDVGDYAKALEVYEAARVEHERLGSLEGAATTLGNSGMVLGALGDYAGALRTLKRALAAKRALGDDEGAAATLANIGVVHFEFGEYAEALLSYEGALAVQEAMKQSFHAALTLCNMGIVYSALGDDARALATYERALATQRAIGDTSGEATTLGNIAGSLRGQGDYARALEAAVKALELDEARGAGVAPASRWIGIGNVHHARGDLAEAQAAYERAAAGAESQDDERLRAEARLGLGIVRDALGDLDGALASYRAALEIQESVEDRAGAAISLGNIAGLELRRGKHAEALAAARRGVELVARLAQGLAHSEVAAARDVHAHMFSIGQGAALALDDLDGLAWFLEQGRAGALRDAFASRPALEAAVLPEALRRELLLARAGERQALDGWRAARAQREAPAAIRRARTAFEQAEAKVGAIYAQAERTARAAATVAFGRIDDLAMVQSHLDVGEALVLYGVDSSVLMALVVEPGGARAVALGTEAGLVVAAEELLARVSRRDAADGLDGFAAALAAQVVLPLALGEHVKRVLVSPAGMLGYVPLAPLFGGREVAYVPSGTMLGLLLGQRGKPGVEILALGDPDTPAPSSGAARLPRLPASREEARAVGTVHLLGQDASESGLTAALAKQPRWRAVHFACHGLVDGAKPMFSSLVLTPEAHEDGFLKALEIFPRRIAADLVVLSACETGTGKVYKTEGIASLAQAFMFAGAPRVICSLWKVDDAATHALMVEFYRLWNPKEGPGLGTAPALREAQRHVRDHPGHPEWKHPYYWAAWVLWGLAD